MMATLMALLLFGQPTGSKGPNIILIMADDLGARDLGFTGSTFHKTPNLDKLAAQSAVFTQAYSACPVCSPSRAGILTGQHPARLHLTDWIPGQSRDGF
jgi:arylsulfatase A-like enzyme